jgi:hypothetical protein
MEMVVRPPSNDNVSNFVNKETLFHGLISKTSAMFGSLAAAALLVLTLCTVNGSSAALASPDGHYALHTFNKIKLTDEFWSEAPAIGDINRDGHTDIVVGPFWYEGPDFTKRHAFYPATQTFHAKNSAGIEETLPGFDGSNDVIDNTDAHYARVIDLNKDGWPDILVVGMEPGHSPTAGQTIIASWYENPGPKGLASGQMWKGHIVAENVGNFQVDFTDLFGNGKPVLLCMLPRQNRTGLYVGYFEPDPDDPTEPWTPHWISPEVAGDYQWWTHGLGHGDLSGHGRSDVLISYGWFEQPAHVVPDAVWKFHPYPFAFGPGELALPTMYGDFVFPQLFDVDSNGVPTRSYQIGGSQMYVDDLTGDGRADVIMSLSAHGYGLAWWEQTGKTSPWGDPTFKRHLIVNKKPSENPFGVVLTEMQAVAYADVDGDGLKDLIVGKRKWAHGKGGMDPGANDAADLYWFQRVREPNHEVGFIPWLIDNDSGAGNLIVVGDVNGDRLPDIVVANKSGAFVFLQKTESVDRKEWLRRQPRKIFPEAR